MRAAKSSSKSALFLIELIIAITFFSLASAICIQLFVRSHLMTVQNRDITNAMNLAQSTVEQWKVSPEGLEGTSTRYYSKEWQPLSGQEEWYYYLELSADKEAVPARLTVRIGQRQEEEPLYELSAKKYIS